MIQIDLRKELSLVLRQVTSARWLIAVIIIWTLCSITDKVANLLVASISSVEMFGMVKEVFIYMVGVISGIAGSATALYFTRSDRKPEQEEHWVKLPPPEAPK